MNAANARYATKLLLILMLIGLLAGCGSVVRPGELGLKFRTLSGEGLRPEPLTEGFHWHMPWNDILTYSIQWQSFREKIECLTEDDLHIIVESSVIARARPTELYQLQMELGPDFYRRVVQPEFLGVVRGVVAGYQMVALPEKGLEIEAKILEELRRRIRKSPVDLRSVSIDHIEYTVGVLKAIEVKLTKEQEKIQKGFERDIAKQDAEIEQIRAQGEADALEITARGKAKAQIIRAGGQAQAQKIIDKTLTKKFLQFKAFDSPNTKFIYVPLGQDGLPIVITPETK